MKPSQNGAQKKANPFLARLDAALTAVGEAEALERKTHDQFLLADAARGALERRIRQGQEIHTSSGAYILDATGKQIDDDEMRRAATKLEDAESAYVSASTVAQQARGRLHNLQKQSEQWERLGAYWADQAVQEASLTPAEREARALREMHQQDLASR